MTIAIVQETGAFSNTNNPALKFPSRVKAGSFLLAFCEQEAFALPGTPTDTAGNVWQQIGAAQNPAGLSLAVYRVPSALAANTTVTFPTTAPSALAIQELSGVLPDQNVGTDNELDQPHDQSEGFQGLSPYATSVNAQATDFCEAVICSFGSVTFTEIGSGWAVLRSLASANVSMQLVTQTPAAAGLLISEWTTPANVQVAVMALALTPA